MIRLHFYFKATGKKVNITDQKSGIFRYNCVTDQPLHPHIYLKSVTQLCVFT